MKLIQIDGDLFVQPRAIAAVRSSGLEDGKCVVFIKGQSAADGGFLVDRPLEEVVEEVNEALSEASVPRGTPEA